MRFELICHLIIVLLVYIFPPSFSLKICTTCREYLHRRVDHWSIAWTASKGVWRYVEPIIVNTIQGRSHTFTEAAVDSFDLYAIRGADNCDHHLPLWWRVLTHSDFLQTILLILNTVIQLIRETGITGGDERKVGHYAGVIVRGGLVYQPIIGIKSPRFLN